MKIAAFLGCLWTIHPDAYLPTNTDMLDVSKGNMTAIEAVIESTQSEDDPEGSSWNGWMDYVWELTCDDEAQEDCYALTIRCKDKE